MAKDALERLFEDAANSQANSNVSQYSIDEQLETSEEDDFFNMMSQESKDKLLQKVQKVELDEDEGSVENIIEQDNTKEDEEVEKSSTDKILEEMIEYDEEPEKSDISEPKKEEQPKRGRGRPRKNPPPEENSSSNNTDETNSSKLNSVSEFMDSLAKDLINDLKNSNYTTRNYSKSQMLVILEHLEKKI